MAQTAPRPAAANDKRRRIMEAALKVFARTGVHGTPVPPVAAEAGVGVGTLYRYFDNKEALVNAVFRDTKARLRARLLDGLEPDGSSRALFDHLWDRLTAFAEQEPEAFQFLELQDHQSYLDTDSLAEESALLGPLNRLVRAGQARGELSTALSPDVAIALFWGAFVGLFKARRLGYLTLDRAALDSARQACWMALSRTPEQEER